MKKRVLSLIILCFFIWEAAGFAIPNYYYNPNGLATATGIVEARGFNTIDIHDEERKRSERFIYLDKNEQFQKGDYVRIYYHPRGGIVQTIKRMTILDYKANGQNLGNIFRH